MRQWTLSLAVVALIAGTTFAGKYNKAVSVGDKAPAIAGVTAVNGDKETTLNLDDIKEDVVVVAFLANHCPAVKASEDRLVDIAKAYKGKSVKFIGVCCSTDSWPIEDGIPAIKTEHQARQVQHHLTDTIPAARSARPTAPPGRPSSSSSTRPAPSSTWARWTTAPMDESKVNKVYLKTAIDDVLGNETVEETETAPSAAASPTSAESDSVRPPGGPSNSNRQAPRRRAIPRRRGRFPLPHPNRPSGLLRP